MIERVVSPVGGDATEPSLNQHPTGNEGVAVAPNVSWWRIGAIALAVAVIVYLAVRYANSED